MPTAEIEQLRSIKTFRQLIAYLKNELDWPIAEDATEEELEFEWTPEELGLDPASAVAIKEIKQLRPLAEGQAWGIFFINFEKKRLPIVILRRILNKLVIKKRAGANRAQRAAWQQHDLLFISSYGEEKERAITFAHFSEPRQAQASDIPTLRVLGWDGDDTNLKYDYIVHTLKDKLSWPREERNLDAWRKRWAEAFVLRPRQVIQTSQELATRLAELARSIRHRANIILKHESEKGKLRRLHKAFQEALIHDLKTDDFADMYAQTVAYGLFALAVRRASVATETAVTADGLHEGIYSTSPFLKEMLETFLAVGGRKGKIDFDELGIQEVVNLLNNPDTHMESILREFGNRDKREDPVIYFYEDFLKEYDSKKRVERGVFYTPQPVVSYIVRSVHELLQTEFALADGLADTATWGEMTRKHAGLKVPDGVKASDPFVVILDPATGTATFLVEVIDVMHRTLVAKWKTEGMTDAQQRTAWNDYVPKHLLPRLHGYELMMAPYAIAHMKIGLKLYETGYRFGSDEPTRIYLTNALEPAQDFSDRLAFDAPALAHEAKAVNEIKRNQRFTVVIGNPPYSGISSNMTEHAQRLVDAYKLVDGEALNERKLWLQDDYVKFIRIAQMTIDATHIGILGHITNHGYLDNPTFRGMRQSLMGTFQHVRVLDLHGNANKKEQAPNGTEDKNVFDIRQGVAICLATHDNSQTSISHADLWGTREAKYAWLGSHSIGTTTYSTLSPDSPYYFFEPRNTDYRAEYDEGWKINEAMPVNCAGFITARDHFVVDFERAPLLERIGEFANPKVSDADIRKRHFAGCGSQKYPDGDTRGWKVPEARRRVRADNQWRNHVRTCLYRPFDSREVYWADWMVDWPRPELTRHLDLRGNMALITTRITKDDFAALVTTTPPGHKSVGAYDVNYVFPLMTASIEESLFSKDSEPHPNFSPMFLKALSKALQMSPSGDHAVPGFTHKDIFHYVYVVFHSPTYRNRYAEFLKIDFPRLPLTSNLDLFHALAELGSELVALHLMESPKLDHHLTTFVGSAKSEAEKVSYSHKTVWIDKAQSTGFKGLPEAVWNFHIGGYQVCEKWLKDRKGRTLSKKDIEHYHRIVVALNETIRIMAEIDEVIERHGGWPIK